MMHNFIFLLYCLGVGGNTVAPQSTPTLDEVLKVADSYERCGAYDAARRQLRRVIRRTAEAPVADDAALRVCALWQRQGELHTSRQCYLDLTHMLGGTEALASARYRAASLAIELDQAEQGRRELVELIDASPYTVGARRAFVLARRLHRELAGAAGEAEFLTGVMSRLAWVGEPGAVPRAAGSDSRALLVESMVELGRIRFVDEHDPKAALRMFSRALPVAHGLPWEDAARLWMARAQRQLGQRAQALRRYREIVRLEQERWHTGRGPHVSAYYDQALYEVGQTYEEEQRWDAAYSAYAALFEQAPTSRLLDDAAYRMASIMGQKTQQPFALREFLRRFPDSRHARGAEAVWTGARERG